MQLALVDEIRVEAFPGGRGSCPFCGGEVIAKCGRRVVHHWAHRNPKGCDAWWENETHWHREWKSFYPLECREVTHKAEDGEIHRADLKTPTGIVIELQHSPMSDTERQSREEFYKNLVWVIDGSAFRKNFHILHLLPDPESQLASNLIWVKARRNFRGITPGIFFRLSEARRDYPDVDFCKASFGRERKDEEIRMCRIHFIEEIKDELEQLYTGHHQYDWVRPRKTWKDAKCPVYVDFGGENLLKLEVYDETGLECVRYVSKRKFVHDTMVERNASEIATQYYPIPELSSYCQG